MDATSYRKQDIVFIIGVHKQDIYPLCCVPTCESQSNSQSHWVQLAKTPENSFVKQFCVFPLSAAAFQHFLCTSLLCMLLPENVHALTQDNKGKNTPLLEHQWRHEEGTASLQRKGKKDILASQVLISENCISLALKWFAVLLVFYKKTSFSKMVWQHFLFIPAIFTKKPQFSKPLFYLTKATPEGKGDWK